MKLTIYSKDCSLQKISPVALNRQQTNCRRTRCFGRLTLIVSRVTQAATAYRRDASRPTDYYHHYLAKNAACIPSCTDYSIIQAARNDRIRQITSRKLVRQCSALIGDWHLNNRTKLVIFGAAHAAMRYNCTIRNKAENF